MLTLNVPERRIYIDETNTFATLKPLSITLEHSLISISKWESYFKKPFLDKTNKTRVEIIYYAWCMCIHPKVDIFIFESLGDAEFDKITSYIEDPMTATKISVPKSTNSYGTREVITSELIYYWMIAYNIPSGYDKWHLNRLLTLIEICTIKNTPKKKSSMRGLIARNQELNSQRRRELNTTG